MLLAASIDPRGLLDFFDALRSQGEPAGLVRYLVSHPPSADRAARLRALIAATPHQATPVLADQQWRELVKICR
jgi:predicted Zn-dependent protease